MTVVPPEELTAVKPAEDSPLTIGTAGVITSGNAPEVRGNPRLDAVVATTLLKFMNAVPAVDASTRTYVGLNPYETVLRSEVSETVAENC